MSQPASICPECGHERIVMSLASHATQLIQPNVTATTPLAELALVCPYCGFVSPLPTREPTDTDSREA